MQEQDKDIQPVIEWLERSNTRPHWEDVAPRSENTKAYWAQWDNLKLFDGVLYRLWENSTGDLATKQLVVPKSLRPSVLHLLHNLPTSGHMGVAKTTKRVRERLYWVNVRRDVYNWCKNCDMCVSRRGPPKKIRVPLAQYNVGSPMERVAIDVLGPLPTSEDGNKYLLIAADYFTKWVEGYALPNQEAVTVADVLVKESVCCLEFYYSFILTRGVISNLLFLGRCADFLASAKLEQHPYIFRVTAWLNGSTKQSKINYPSMYRITSGRDWDKHIPFLLMTYRTTVHEATGHSPVQPMLGRNLRLPIELIMERSEEESPQLTTSYAGQLQEKLEDVHQFARDHLQLASDKMKERYDASSQGQILDHGDAVWLHNPQRRKRVTPKLARKWQGPYVVIERINDVVYRIQLGPRTKPRVIHHNRLWKYNGQSPPTWLKATERPTNVEVEIVDEDGIDRSITEVDVTNEQATSSVMDSNDRSHSDPQHNSTSTTQKSSRKRKLPERYGQDSKKKRKRRVVL